MYFSEPDEMYGGVKRASVAALTETMANLGKITTVYYKIILIREHFTTKSADQRILIRIRYLKSMG